MKFSVSQVSSALERLERLRLQCREMLTGDFPIKTSHDALVRIEGILDREYGLLKGLDEADSAVIQETIQNTVVVEDELLFALGLLIRSTHTRNAFECYYALQKLTGELLGPDFRLIFSSEWAYSPLTYPLSFQEIEEFVFIGFPVTESNNSFLIPLAAHEIAHTVWAVREFDKYFGGIVENAVREHIEDSERKVDFEDLIFIGQCEKLILNQIQEAFCDIFATLVFGESFAYAFESYLAPGLPSRGGLTYPHESTRAKIISLVLESEFKIGAGEFVSRFAAAQRSTGKHERYETTCDAVTASLIPDLIATGKKELANSAVAPINSDRVLRVAESFARMGPHVEFATLQEIMCAAWSVKVDIDRDEAIRDVATKRTRVLNEVIYKTLEIKEVSELNDQRS